MGRPKRRELSLGIWSVEARLVVTRGRSRGRGGSRPRLFVQSLSLTSHRPAQQVTLSDASLASTRMTV
jgi:hypothetical protein